jgi:hypothetical protein
VDQKAAEAFNRLHIDDRGAYIPGNMFEQSILTGARAGNVKNGRASYATLLEAIMFTKGPLYLGKTTYDEVFATWGRVPPGPRGAAVMIRYPKFNLGWRADFELILTTGDKHTVEAVRQCLTAAGLLVGLGSWRPRYGRFTVTEFESNI